MQVCSFAIFLFHIHFLLLFNGLHFCLTVVEETEGVCMYHIGYLGKQS